MPSNLITVARDPSYAPCGFLLCRVRDDGSWSTRDEANTIPMQLDWGWPSAAASFGYVPCECGETDGTVDCAHKTADDMISEAFDYLCDHQGDLVEDPGYFNT